MTTTEESNKQILYDVGYKIDPVLYEKIKKCKFGVEVKRDNAGKNSITIYSLSQRTLSDNMPILTNMGFRIDSEMSHALTYEEQTLYIRRYFVLCTDCDLLESSKTHIEDVMESVFLGQMENSPLNSLAFHVNLSPRNIRLISALSRYQNQIITEYNQLLINHTLVKYPTIVHSFIDFFNFKFDPEVKNRANNLKKTEEKIEKGIKAIQDITEDRVLLIFYRILKSLTRTNVFFPEFENDGAMAFKIDVTQLFEYLTDVQPRIEIFVYHPCMQGTHLRRHPVSRGGLRWSDRFEDYRNEIRHLMSAQRQKNAIITPSGAKGGFVITTDNVDKKKFKELYSVYINALLDMVDNRKDDEIIQKEKQLIYDEEDTYFVVAADKGTSDMSDVANEISARRDFWLGDAFASGGSRGYNHKEMGITAKGSIKSVERFFIELKTNFYESPITVAGIGSPAGDVFGNGILLSDKFSLVAAISSRYIFVDPAPDCDIAWRERKRLFENNFGWQHYDKKKLSEGGGVYRKDDKEIELSKEAKRLLGIKKEIVNGEELTRAILTANVDMLFNGGVGTYVKGSHENNSEIGDKPNESVRVNAKDIKAFSVCEGGNLGFTQKARIEYAKRGGRISSDSIDNSAGVQTSDYEVNLKIILNNLIQKGVMKEESRWEILSSLIPDVEKTVLNTNYFQSLALSLDEQRSKTDLKRFKDTVFVLEDHVESFMRSHFDIPSPDDFMNALTKNGTVLRPILGVLLSYSKIFLKYFLLKNEAFLDSGFAQQYIYKYFPKTFGALYKKEVEKHPLRRQIIATYIADKTINFQGSTFIADFNTLGEEKFLLKIRAFLAVNQLISANDIRFEISRMDYQFPVKKQYDLLLQLEETVAFLVNWVMEHGEHKVSVFDHMLEYKKAFKDFIQSVDSSCVKEFAEGNETVNRYFSMIDYVRMVLTIFSVKESTHQSFQDVADLFFKATQDMEVLYLTDSVKNLNADSQWEERLKSELEKDIFESIFIIIEKIMKFKRSNEAIETAYGVFCEINHDRYSDYFHDLRELKSATGSNYVNLSVAINSLKKIAYASH